jgi:hypothetical protein
MEQSDARSDDLSEVERRLIDSVACGIELDLAGAEQIDEAAMKRWGASKTVRASVIRDVLRGRHVKDPDPHGVQLRGAKIVGRLDLEGLTSGVSLTLTACHLNEGVNARGAQLPALGLRQCRAENQSGAPLDAERLSTQVLDLTGFTANTNFGCTGTVHLAYAHIGGVLNASGATLINNAGPALSADGLRVDGTLFLSKGFTATGNGDSGAVSLIGAHIGGQLNASKASLTNNTGPALNANTLHVDGDLLMSEGFTATGSGDAGAVSLTGAHIGGNLDLSQVTLSNQSGPALNADLLQVDGDLFLSEGFTATGSGDAGAVSLLGAHVVRTLDLSRATLTNQSGPALNADTLRVDSDLILDWFTATGNGDSGAVSLLGAHIGNQLNASGATLTNQSGPALDADTLRIDSDLLLDGFTATGSGDSGAVRLLGAHIGSQLNASGATLTNQSGPALDADTLRIGDGLLLSDGFTATGSGDSGAVRLLGAHIGSQLNASGATLTNQSGPALNADSLQVDGDLLLTPKFAATGSGDAVNLSNAHISGRISLNVATIRDSSGKPGKLALDGLVYAGLPQLADPAGKPILSAATEWLEILRARTSGYSPQPYRQLAAASQAAGHDAVTRQILMAQRTDQLDRAKMTRTERAWGKFTGVTLGYGYQPWRALLGLLGIVILAVILNVSYGAQGGLAHTKASGSPGTPCSTLERVGVGLNFSVPVVNIGAGGTCGTSQSAAGNTITISGWILQLAAWSLATLFIAGFTGVVRKT